MMYHVIKIKQKIWRTKKKLTDKSSFIYRVVRSRSLSSGLELSGSQYNLLSANPTCCRGPVYRLCSVAERLCVLINTIVEVARHWLSYSHQLRDSLFHAWSWNVPSTSRGEICSSALALHSTLHRTIAAILSPRIPSIYPLPLSNISNVFSYLTLIQRYPSMPEMPVAITMFTNLPHT